MQKSDAVEQYQGWWATKPVRVKEGVLFSYYSPSAREVFLAGDFNGWKKRATPLIKGRDDVWRIILELKPGRYYDYKYIVDGNWLNDPNNPDLNPDVAGGANSVIYIGANGDILPQGHPERHKFSLEGRGIYLKSYQSRKYNRKFEFHYVSLEHREGDKLPVIICLNNYVKSQELHLFARENRFLAIVPSVDLGGQYIRQGRLDVFPELLDVIKKSFSIDEDRVFVTGMSNGALEALLASMHYPDLIAASAVVFGPFKVRFYKDEIGNLNKAELEKFIDTLGYPQRMLTNLKNLPIYISHGGGDEAVPLEEGLVLHEIVKKLGAPTEFTSYPQYGHTWHMVDEDLPRVFAWVRRFKRNKFPRDISYTLPNGFFKNGIYWIDFSPFKIEDEIKIKATVSRDNRIKLDLQNIKWIKMRLNSHLLKLPGLVHVETQNSTQEMEILDEEKDIELAF